MSRKMKDSGVEWVGEIPEEWSVCRLKSHPQAVSIIAGQSPAGEDIKSEPTGPDYVEFHQGNSLFTSSGHIDRSDRYALPGKLAIPQDILVSMRAPVGEIAKSNRPIVMGRGLAAIRGKDNWHKFGYYWMLAIGQELRAQSSGTTFDGISTRFLSNIPVLSLPLSEQQAIADYLDTKVGEIDTNISKLKSASALLSELKQSVIYEAVTGKTFEGKVIDRKMKDSEVEWIGEIPEGWQFKKVKQVLKWTTGFTPDTSNTAAYEGEDYWANISDMGPRYINSTAKTINGKMFPSKHKVPAASLLFSFKLSIGGVSFTGVDMYTNEAICAFSKESAMSLNYAYYATPVYIVKNCKQNIYGADLLNQQLIDNATILVPPLSEQQAIADYLDRKVGEIDNKISIIERKIELLAELKQSVIYEAVTGKIDMRTMDAPANTYNTNKVA